MKIGPRSMGRNRLIDLHLPGRLLALFVIAVGSWLLVLPVAYFISGATGMVAASVAAMICLGCGAIAMLSASVVSGPHAAMNGALIAMLVRMAGLLALGVGLHLGVPEFAAAGLIFYLLLFYMIDLTVETVLQIGTLGAAKSNSWEAVR